MKKRFIKSIAIMLVLIVALTGCTEASNVENTSVDDEKKTGNIYLYGEHHSNKKILDKEIELWDDYYQNQGMRHLFIELGYFSAEYLNLWMKADNDDILEEVFNDAKGTPGDSDVTRNFYKQIKEKYPETIFHGTDIGHSYKTTGARYLKYLEDNKLTGTEQYEITKEAIEQGRYFYENNHDFAYRENKMVENFRREFDKLNNESIMGIYGAAHIGVEAMGYKCPEVPSMANQLNKIYPEILNSEDLSYIIKQIDSIRTDTVTIGGKEYKASYYGLEDMTGFKNFVSREFWRVEDAYEDFKDKPKTGNYLPADNYAMIIEKNELYIVEFTMNDKSKMKIYFRCDGVEKEGMLISEEITID